MKSCYNGWFVLPLLPAFIAAVAALFRSRVDIALEVLALPQQVAVLKRQQPRPPLTRFDRFFWSTLRQMWPRWSDVLVIVKPETAIRWASNGFSSILALAITPTWWAAED